MILCINERKTSGACVADPFARAKGAWKRLDTFTVPREGRKQRAVSTRRKYALWLQELSIGLRKFISFCDRAVRSPCPPWVKKKRNTRYEQMFTALPPTTDILAGLLRGLRSKSNTASAS